MNPSAIERQPAAARGSGDSLSQGPANPRHQEQQKKVNNGHVPPFRVVPERSRHSLDNYCHCQSRPLSLPAIVLSRQ